MERTGGVHRTVNDPCFHIGLVDGEGRGDFGVLELLGG